MRGAAGSLSWGPRPAYGKVATLFALDQDTTSWVWEDPREQGNANQTNAETAPRLVKEIRAQMSHVSFSSTTCSCGREGTSVGASVYV